MSNVEEAKPAATSESRFLIYQCGDKTFGTPLTTIREIIKSRYVKPVANTAEYFMGLVNIRGQVVGIVDLTAKLEIEIQQNKNNDHAVFIVVDTDEGAMGVSVDKVLSVQEISSVNIDFNPKVESNINPQELIGIAEFDEHFIILMDLKETLSNTSLLSFGESKFIDSVV
ncbi:MAG: hypothetical protein CMP10_15485 [Zetaproteobacteria bacterium]|nr:hypothetical protein [Pseudobdellovibrionaceae bacterium]|tara:strand:- start:529 stop:1038 length:510 start_codon:yes stop_codon:yes gene_type:complete